MDVIIFWPLKFGYHAPVALPVDRRRPFRVAHKPKLRSNNVADDRGPNVTDVSWLRSLANQILGCAHQAKTSTVNWVAEPAY